MDVLPAVPAAAAVRALARLPYRGRRELVLTTTLQPCLQCAAAIRLGPIATVRFAGPDRYWDGCHDFGRLRGGGEVERLGCPWFRLQDIAKVQAA